MEEDVQWRKDKRAMVMAVKRNKNLYTSESSYCDFDGADF